MNMLELLGIQANDKLGFLEVFNLLFDGNELKISGKNGSGKSTLLTAFLSHDKKLIKDGRFENYNVTTFYRDGEYSVEIRVFESEDGKKGYVIKAHDKDGNEVKEIDGIKLTATGYQKLIQSDVISNTKGLSSDSELENREASTKLYKPALERLDVATQQKELATLKDKRTIADDKRKQVGDGVEGTYEFLITKGIKPHETDTHPKRTDVHSIEKNIVEKKYERKTTKQGGQKTKNEAIEKVDLEGKNMTLKIKSYNDSLDKKQAKKEAIEKAYKIVVDNLDFLTKEGVISQHIVEDINSSYLKPKESEERKISIENDIVVDNGVGLFGEGKILYDKRNVILNRWNALRNSDVDDIATPELDLEIEDLEKKIESGKENNKLVDSCEAFINWKESDTAVKNKANEIAEAYESIDTRVKGLSFIYDKETSKINLCYNGGNFGNFFHTNGEYRPVYKFSETERQLVVFAIQCSFLKNYEDGGQKKVLIAFVDAQVDTQMYEKLVGIRNFYNPKIKMIVTNVKDDVTDLEDNEIYVENGNLLTSDGSDGGVI